MRGMTLAAVLLFLTAAGTALYWVLFYTTGMVQSETSAVYLAFESAFPPADTWMAICLVLAGVGMLRRQAWGLLFGLLAASALIFLGLMDVTYNINQDMYRQMSPEMAIETGINLWTLGLGACLIPYLWRRRHLFLSFEQPPAAGTRRARA